jgi:carbon monoxide dehydrogenase subunit G
MSDFVSDIKTIPHPQKKVYEYLSDLNNLAQVKERLKDPAFQDKLQQEADKYNAGDLREKLDKISFDRDSMSFSGSPVGDVCLRIIEREEPKTIKFEGEHTPIAVNLWIQLVPIDENSCKMKLTLRAELNMFIRGMVSKPLQQGVDNIANVLATLPYNN